MATCQFRHRLLRPSDSNCVILHTDSFATNMVRYKSGTKRRLRHRLSASHDASGDHRDAIVMEISAAIKMWKGWHKISPCNPRSRVTWRAVNCRNEDVKRREKHTRIKVKPGAENLMELAFYGFFGGSARFNDTLRVPCSGRLEWINLAS